MPAWSSLPLAHRVELRIVGDMPPLGPVLEATVARRWNEAAALRPLFNGRVFCADRITPGRIDGHWTEYRRVIAQMADPGLFRALRVRSLAVCGVLTGPDGVAIGRREPRSAYQAGLWQLPPAGSVDQKAARPGGASWHHAILAELREELGLQETDVLSLDPLCLVQHPTGVLDMGIRIRTGLRAADVLARHREHGDGEYDRLLVLPETAVIAEVESQGGTLVPSVRPFLGLPFLA